MVNKIVLLVLAICSCMIFSSEAYATSIVYSYAPVAKLISLIFYLLGLCTICYGVYLLGARKYTPVIKSLILPVVLILMGILSLIFLYCPFTFELSAILLGDYIILQLILSLILIAGGIYMMGVYNAKIDKPSLMTILRVFSVGVLLFVFAYLFIGFVNNVTGIWG